MKTNKYEGIPIVKLKLLYSQHNSPERDEIMNEMVRQELAKETRDRKNHYIQKIVMVLSILIFIFTAITFFSPLFNNKNKVTNNTISGNLEDIQPNTTDNSPMQVIKTEK